MYLMYLMCIMYLTQLYKTINLNIKLNSIKNLLKVYTIRNINYCCQIRTYYLI